jgi:hypothetical protein
MVLDGQLAFFYTSVDPAIVPLYTFKVTVARINEGMGCRSNE